MRKLSAVACALILLLPVGCWKTNGGTGNGGKATVASASIGSSPAGGGELLPTLGMPSVGMTQPNNPNSTSAQSVDYEYEEIVELPAETVRETTTTYPDGRSISVREPQPAGTKIIKKTRSKVNQELGGSWKDTAKEFAAALGSFATVQYAGIAILLFGAVGFFHPVVRTLIGGKDVAMAVGACGAAMMFGPFLFVRYSNYFFLAIVLAGVYWLLARFKYQHGKLDALESAQEK